MNMYDLIEKKKHHLELSTEEIQWWILAYTNHTIPDYQVSALLMAIYFQGMSENETHDMTMAMRDSGEILDLSSICGVKVDEHSTGGVGDKTTLTLAPLIASLGVPVAKLSGRGLGHTGGTIDKLECFPEFQTTMPTGEFLQRVNTNHIAIAGQTANIAPADKLLYALRDTTACVDEKSLIASSIMSKKLASGADAICLDVKVGSGAFMKDLNQARELARLMVSIGKHAHKETHALLTNMDEPLGYAVGNTLEVIEAVHALEGQGPEDFMEVVYALGHHMLLLGKKSSSKEESYQLMDKAISSGAALDKLKELVQSQGSDAMYVDQVDSLLHANFCEEVKASTNGYVSSIDAMRIGHASMLLGGGRQVKEDRIDLNVGIVLQKKVGDQVLENDVLAVIYANDDVKSQMAVKEIKEAVIISKNQVTRMPMILDEIYEKI